MFINNLNLSGKEYRYFCGSNYIGITVHALHTVVNTDMHIADHRSNAGLVLSKR